MSPPPQYRQVAQCNEHRISSAPIHMEVDGIPAVLPVLSVELPDGRTGYYQRSPDECLKAAVAVATQVPYDELPDIGSLRELYAWADQEGFVVQMHFPPDLPVTEPQWIGVSPKLPGSQARHTIVAAYRAQYFDPAAGWVFPGGASAPPIRDLDHAITLTRTGS